MATSKSATPKSAASKSAAPKSTKSKSAKAKSPTEQSPTEKSRTEKSLAAKASGARRASGKSGARISSLAPVEEDIQHFERVPETPQTMAPAYQLAFVDQTFMRSDELRGARLQLEYLKPEMILEKLGITSTVIMFGGARIPAPGQAPSASTETARANLASYAGYYDEARKFARLASEESLRRDGRELVIATGGGPGIMEAGNLGAQDVGAASIGLNIVLPHEQAPNEYVTPDLCFNFHYFAIRKMHFLMRAHAIVVFPGGFGTLDELFEVLTLVQTQRMARVPILLFGRSFWQSIIDFDALAAAGTISPEDLDLFDYVEDADDAWSRICDIYSIDARVGEKMN